MQIFENETYFRMKVIVVSLVLESVELKKFFYCVKICVFV